jgi:hypothetical protein
MSRPAESLHVELLGKDLQNRVRHLHEIMQTEIADDLGQSPIITARAGRKLPRSADHPGF